MSRQNRKHRTWKLPLDSHVFEKLAAQLMSPVMTALVTSDHRLCKTSGIWRKANGTLTCRFAYRSSAGNSIVETLRNVPDPRIRSVAADG